MQMARQDFLKLLGAAALSTLKGPAAEPHAPPAETATVLIDAGKKQGRLEMSRYGLVQGGISSEPMYDAQAEMIAPLNLKLIRLFIQEYFDVYPSRGVYNWRTLDRSVDNILRIGAKPIMCICIKPKALYPEIDQDKVRPTSYEEWEELIFRMVQHYNLDLGYKLPYWEVANEPDIGEDGGCPSRFTPDGYCTHYAHTARAIRRADAEAKVGGPALADYQSPILEALLKYCSQNGLPIDFVSWHMYTSDPAEIRGSIDSVRRLVGRFRSLHYETILDEWNMSLDDPRLEPPFQPCFILDSVYQMLEAGLDYSCYYHIREYYASREEFSRFMSSRGTRRMVVFCNYTPQYLGLFDSQGISRPSFFVFKILGRLTGDRVEGNSDRSGVKVLAAYDSENAIFQAVIWNFSLKPPPAVRVQLTVKNLPSQNWELRRFMLDSETASNAENDRIKLAQAQKMERASVCLEEFELPGYGVAFVTLEEPIS